MWIFRFNIKNEMYFYFALIFLNIWSMQSESSMKYELSAGKSYLEAAFKRGGLLFYIL